MFRIFNWKTLHLVVYLKRKTSIISERLVISCIIMNISSKEFMMFRFYHDQKLPFLFYSTPEVVFLCSMHCGFVEELKFEIAGCAKP
jgi:hypothetical protein